MNVNSPHRTYLCRTNGNDIPPGGVVSIVPGQPYIGVDSEPNKARNNSLLGKVYLEVRTPTEEDQHAQDPDMTLIAENGLASGELGLCARVNKAASMMMSSIVGASEEDTVTDEQYQGMPLGVCAGSPYLHRGGGCFRAIDWAFPHSGSSVAFVDIVSGINSVWFKTEETLFEDADPASSGTLSSDLVDLYYMGKDSESGQSTLTASHSLTEDEPLQVRAYHMGSSIPSGSYGQLSRVGGRWCVSAVYC